MVAARGAIGLWPLGPGPQVLENTDHNAFPVVLRPGSGVLVGLVTRSQLEIILALDESVLLTDAESWLSRRSPPPGRGWRTQRPARVGGLPDRPALNGWCGGTDTVRLGLLCLESG